MKSKPPSPAPPSSSLSSSATTLINSLNFDQKRLFYKVLREECNKLIPSALLRDSGALTLYFLIEKLREKYKIRGAHLTLLTHIYYLSRQGADPVPLPALLSLYSNAHHIYNYTNELMKKGYIERRTGSYKHLYISAAGVKLINQLHDELRALIYKTSIPPDLQIL